MPAVRTALPVVDLRDEPAALLTLPAELAARARGVTTDPANERISSIYGRNAWKSRLRAHPDVAAAHQYM